MLSFPTCGTRTTGGTQRVSRWSTKSQKFHFLQKLLLIPQKLLCKRCFFWMYSSLVSLLTPSPLHIPFCPLSIWTGVVRKFYFVHLVVRGWKKVGNPWSRTSTERLKNNSLGENLLNLAINHCIWWWKI